jgi:hypothetical protein
MIQITAALEIWRFDTPSVAISDSNWKRGGIQKNHLKCVNHTSLRMYGGIGV